jgi:hypothetical protein
MLKRTSYPKLVANGAGVSEVRFIVGRFQNGLAQVEVRRKGSRSHVGEKTYEERPGHHRRHDRKVGKIKHRRPDQIPD